MNAQQDRDGFVTSDALEAALAQPSQALIDDLARLDGHILVLGAGGKMGPSLVKLALEAVRKSGSPKRVIAVSRFSRAAVREDLDAAGAKTVSVDLLDERAMEALPDAKNVLYMVATKFGTHGREHLTWAQNAFLPGLVAQRYRESRIVAFSTGNVYPLMPVASGGSRESDRTAPVGEYAQSCLGRERLFEFMSDRHGMPVLIFRLNYAADLRYGVLLDVAQAVRGGDPVDLTMGFVNVIWQGDANEAALRALHLADSPPRALNVTGPETVSVRWLAERFGERFGVKPFLVNEERPTALLSNAAEAHGLFGYPRVPLARMIEWTARWLEAGGETLDKPTHFTQREGKF